MNPRDIRLGGKAALFEELAQPDEMGVSRAVDVDEFDGYYAELYFTGNGGSWCRSDGPLGRKYIIDRPKDGQNGSISSVQLMGFNDNPINTHRNCGEKSRKVSNASS